MESGHELFIHGLTDILDGEQQLVDALQKLADDSTNPQLKKAFETHRRETEEQIERLNQCFQLLGETPEQSECKGLKGLIEEKEAFSEEDPEPDILDIFDVGAAIKAETYEICEYKSLIQMARAMKHAKAAQLLTQTLKEEQATLKKMEAFQKKLKPEQMMTEQQQEKARASSKSSGSGRKNRKRAA
ncbi:MAG TPA: DUF892 family protein [Candidatus Angelobacter sp.]|jgi:ferritin-like metal-binding protein YciE|nr:DUF892 family protein [Candidatus Angelobacter sp.]